MTTTTMVMKVRVVLITIQHTDIHHPMMKAESATLKMVFVGDSNAGKTSAIQLLRAAAQSGCLANASAPLPLPQPETATTVGVSFCSIKVRVQSRDVAVVCHDTAGQERFRAITRGFYRVRPPPEPHTL